MTTAMKDLPADSSKRRVAPLNKGDANLNPKDIGFMALLKEDYVTHDRSLVELGLWAVWTHRFGNWRMGIKPKLVRAPFSVLYKIAYYWVNWFWGIKLDYTVKLGRRVRLWHHGGMILGAREIGDDVHIRQNTTFGLADRTEPNAKPTIGNRVEIGTGAVIVGDIRIGDGAVIGANAVVTRDIPPQVMAGGVPAKVIRHLANSADKAPAKGPASVDSSPREGANATPACKAMENAKDSKRYRQG